MRDRRLDEALARYLDDEPEPEDGPVLAAAMQLDPEFAAEVRRLLVVDDLLRQHSEPDAEAFLDALTLRTSDAGGDLAARLESELRPTHRTRPVVGLWLPWIIAAAACVVATAGLLRNDRPAVHVVEGPPNNAASPAPPELQEVAAGSADAGRAIAALLVNEVDAKFAPEAAPDAVRFQAGVYELLEGAVHLRFSSGADVVIPSPARFTVHGPMRMALERGSLRAMVSPTAHGFTVDAPGIAYEDLGTEFGVSVANGRPQSEVHVFAGAVDIKSPDGKKLSSLTFGESASVHEGQIGPAGPPEPGLFPTPADIGLLRWRRWRDRLRSDPSLVCYFPFEPWANDASVLTDATGAVDGRIHGARWVSGRWPGKQALLFDQQGDAVEVALPDEYRQLTVAAWIRVERLDFELNSIFDSDGWERGDLHLQLTRTGQMQGGLYGNANQWEPRPTMPVGRWTHFAVTVDMDERSIKTYLDGALVGESVVESPNALLQPGLCRIGDWLRRPDWEHVPERGFRGRIDEFAIWNRALSEAEIHEQVDAGRPSLLEHVASVLTDLAKDD